MIWLVIFKPILGPPLLPVSFCLWPFPCFSELWQYRCQWLSNEDKVSLEAELPKVPLAMFREGCEPKVLSPASAWCLGSVRRCYTTIPCSSLLGGHTRLETLKEHRRLYLDGRRNASVRMTTQSLRGPHRWGQAGQKRLRTAATATSGSKGPRISLGSILAPLHPD